MPPAFNLSQDQTLTFNPTIKNFISLTKCPLSLFFFILNQLHHSLGDAYSTLLDFIVNAFFKLFRFFLHTRLFLINYN